MKQLVVISGILLVLIVGSVFGAMSLGKPNPGTKTTPPTTPYCNLNSSLMFYGNANYTDSSQTVTVAIKSSAHITSYKFENRTSTSGQTGSLDVPANPNTVVKVNLSPITGIVRGDSYVVILTEGCSGREWVGSVAFS